MVTFKRVSPEQWEALPPPSPKKKADAWDEAMEALAAGEILAFAAGDETELRGKRIGIARRARARGFAVEYRLQDEQLYVKRSDQPLKPTAQKDKPTTSRRGRPRKATNQPAEEPTNQE